MAFVRLAYSSSIKELIWHLTTMDLFEIPDDYKPEKPLTDAEMDDITNYLKGHPLFLKEIPEDISSNEHLVALQSFKEEEDPQITAENLNKQANARFKQGPNSPYYMKDAYAKYTQAINLKPKNPTLLAKLHTNRAMINLKYKNYGKVIEDCKVSLKCDPTNVKTFYRMGRAYIALKKYKECTELLANQTDSDLNALLKEAVQLKEKDESATKKLAEKETMTNNKIQQYFKARNWRLGKRNEQLPQSVEIQFIEDKISIPIVIVYPEFSQFDIIAKTGQTQRLSECLKELFSSPLPWDTKEDYKYNSIQIYSQVQEAVLLKLPKQATMSQIAARVPVKGAIEIIILANNQFASYYKDQYKIY